jgi:hypothetical protein
MGELSLSLDGSPDEVFLRAHDAACRIAAVRNASSVTRTLEADLNRLKVTLAVAVHAGTEGTSLLHVARGAGPERGIVKGGPMTAERYRFVNDPWGEARSQFVAALGDPDYRLPVIELNRVEQSLLNIGCALLLATPIAFVGWVIYGWVTGAATR